MSPSKLIIHKIEGSGIRYKYVYFKIENDERCTSYSEWTDGDIQEESKDSEKASRLVVKIVSGNEFDKFNLDISAKEVDETVRYVANASLQSSMQKKPSNELNYKLCDFKDELYDNDTDPILVRQPTTFQHSVNYDVNLLAKGKSNLGNNDNYLSPLEQSLEKVKENNARIMENIHMLNRTLNYTKKKEILGIVCPKSMRSYPCNTCGKCFVYETGLRRHYTMRHAMTDIQPRWQVVWTCIQCFQVWPHQDQAVKHSGECCKSNNIDCVREIKTSSLLQCEFCEKVYTSIPRLLRHSKVHTTANNYECNACRVAFSSYKMAEQHWMLCPWLKMYYSFSLPKLLLCNACDRKFRNYEQLYNHRYKVGHFMTKTHCNQGTVRSMGILVYQCEMCDQWYPSIIQLKTHKNQYHPRHDVGMQCRMDKNCKDSQDYYIPADNEYYANQHEVVKPS